MKSKKALLLGEHVVNIIVAVLCILVLVYLGFQIYNLYLGAKQEKEEAKYTLEMIIGAIQEIKKEGGEITKPIVNPKNWYILYFEKASAPKQCAGGSCLCICKGPSECQENGVCQSIDNLEIASECISALTQKNCITLKEPVGLLFYKEGERVKIILEKDSWVRENLVELLDSNMDSKNFIDILSDFIKKRETSEKPVELKDYEALDEYLEKFSDSKNFRYWIFEIKNKNGVNILTLNEKDASGMGVSFKLTNPQTKIINVNEKEYIISLTLSENVE